MYHVAHHDNVYTAKDLVICIAHIQSLMIFHVAFTTLGVKVYGKQCQLCQVTFTYTDYSEGLHNFDNHTILTLKLCQFLRSCIQVATLRKMCYEFIKVIFSCLHVECIHINALTLLRSCSSIISVCC